MAKLSVSNADQRHPNAPSLPKNPTIADMARHYFDYLVADPEGACLELTLCDLGLNLSDEQEKVLAEFGRVLHKKLRKAVTPKKDESALLDAVDAIYMARDKIGTIKQLNLDILEDGQAPNYLPAAVDV